MHRPGIWLMIAFVFLGLLSCGSEDHDSGTGPDTVPATKSIEFADYAFLDTTGFVLVKMDNWSSTPPGEGYLWWEQSLGEPFTDVNGNGVYERGIDIFTRSSNDSINQDLNHNGLYDGPDAEWTPGIPFDDIDGNGTLRFEMEYSPRVRQIEPGVPICDVNHNGVRDSMLEFDNYVMARCSLVTANESCGTYRFYQRDSAFSFTSDSGLTYCVSPLGWEPRPSLPLWISGLPHITIHGNDTGLTLLYDNMIVQVLTPGTNTVDTGLSAAGWYYPDYTTPITFRKSLHLDQNLVVENDTCTGLLRVDLDDPAGSSQEMDDWLGYWRIYFSKTLGLVAVTAKTCADCGVHSFYFNTRFDTIPQPMVKP